ncbi:MULTISPECIES: site-specific integrase [unclassified Beijerinckia]|uniref:tyrosine-type recombinase/integrase n=1 Tax=unclassified Beijerinckia TaxID=2638183 RepID=UPI00089D5C65|nr:MULTISPECIES: site-specific integrase [unclassified Beijerinckia]MDH7796365.1 integrase [Beijerinckia sp. GAS462]SEC42015.1 Site-specific recombinase XerD [Beijerinckia sp. 28-YEA-48]
MSKLYSREDSPFWYAEVQVGGTIKRISTGIAKGSRTRKQAQQVADERERKAVSDIVIQHSVRFSTAWTVFAAANPNELRETTLDQYGKLIARFIHEAGDPALAEMTPAWFRLHIKTVRKENKIPDIQLRLQLSAISTVIEFCIADEMEGAPEFNPIKLINKKHLKKSKYQPRWLRPEEVRKLLVAAKDHRFWPFFIMLILETGMRKSEALHLEWDEIDFRKRVIDLNHLREKTKRGRLIPLSDTALRTLSVLRTRTNSRYVFASPYTGKPWVSINEGWGVLRKKAGLPTKRIHDLRHTFASWTRQLGMSKEDRKDIIGHNSEDSHSRYAYASIETLTESMQKHSPHTLLTQLTE